MACTIIDDRTDAGALVENGVYGNMLKNLASLSSRVPCG